MQYGITGIEPWPWYGRPWHAVIPPPQPPPHFNRCNWGSYHWNYISAPTIAQPWVDPVARYGLLLVRKSNEKDRRA